MAEHRERAPDAFSGAIGDADHALGMALQKLRAVEPQGAQPPLVAYFGPDIGDSAVRRRVRQWRHAGFRVLALAFSRDHEADPDADGFIHLGHIAPQSRARRAIPLAMACLRLLVTRRALRKADVLVARNLDNLLLALFIRRAAAAGVPLVYEILDVNPSCTAPGWRGAVLRWLERRAIAHIDLLVVSSPYFATAYYQERLGYRRSWFLFENKVPRSHGLPRARAATTATTASHGDGARRPRWRIGWFGYLDDQRSWRVLRRAAEELPDDVAVLVCGTPYTNFDMGGFLADVARLDNVCYGGPYRNPEDLAALYDSVDMIWSVDCNVPTANSKWLLTNGLYEAGYFGKPALGLGGTAVGEFLTRWGSGWSLAEPLENDLMRFLRELTIEDYAERRRAIAALPTEVLVETDEIERLWQMLEHRPARRDATAGSATQIRASS